MTGLGRRSLASGVAGVLIGLLAGCGVTRGDDSRDILMIIPNSPGGGYDLTGRDAVKVLEDQDITGGSITVQNIVGAGGAVAMTELVGEVGDEHTLMTVGLGVVGSTYSFGSEFGLTDATPIAQLMSEPEGILVPGDSPYETVEDFLEAWRADPGSLSIGGGSSPGGPDHLFPMQLADAVGIDPNDVNYVPYDGGGPLTSALLGRKIDAGFSGLPEFEGSIDSGELRVLAVSGEERYPEGSPFADAPTLKESDVDLAFLNWRGVLAPPELSEQRVEELVAYFEEMHATEQWQQVVEDNGWTDDFRTGEEFGEFLEEQDERVSSTLEELGLL